MFEAVVFVFLRGIVATLIAVAAVAVTLAAAYMRSDPGVALVAAFVAFTAFGWALLPAIRHSRALALVAAIAWVCFGAYVSSLDHRPGSGWLIGPWLLATLMVVLLMQIPARGQISQVPGAPPHPAPQRPSEVSAPGQADTGVNTPKERAD